MIYELLIVLPTEFIFTDVELGSKFMDGHFRTTVNRRDLATKHSN